MGRNYLKKEAIYAAKIEMTPFRLIEIKDVEWGDGLSPRGVPALEKRGKYRSKISTGCWHSSAIKIW